MEQRERTTRQGIPKESYCFQCTQRQMTYLLWSILFLFVAACCGVAFFYELLPAADKTLEDYFALVVVGAIAVGSAIAFIYAVYIGIKDPFFPAKSRLARSIRDHLPLSDKELPVRDLFAIVDKDIIENGIWFDFPNVAVGKEWIMGEEACYIPDIRVVAGRDQINSRRSGSSRIIELHILDDRQKGQTATLRSPNELKQLLDCLKLRAPDALFVSYNEYSSYQTKPESEWAAVDLEYRNRKARRESNALQNNKEVTQNMILSLSDGSVTSRVTDDLIRQTLSQILHKEGAYFTLTPGLPLEYGGQRYSMMQCVALDPENSPLETTYLTQIPYLGNARDFWLTLALAPEQSGGRPQEGFLIQCSSIRAEEILLTWLHGELPDLTDWQKSTLHSSRSSAQNSQVNCAVLTLISASGVRQNHTNFTREDVQAGADGIAEGKYSQIALRPVNGSSLWIWVQTDNKTNGRCTVTASRPDPDLLRFFTAGCTARQAAVWLMGYYDGSFRPHGSEWKDCTKEIEKKR